MSPDQIIDIKLVEKFEQEVTNQLKTSAATASLLQNEDFKSLAIGWAIANGLGAEDAFSFATYLAYHTDLL